MDVLELVRLRPLMALTQGRADVVVGLIDGPVATRHQAFGATGFRDLSGEGSCRHITASACEHGTLVAGVLAAARGSVAPAICPACTFLIRPIFREGTGIDQAAATPEDLAAAIVATVDAGACILNLSVALMHPSAKGVAELNHAFDYAARRGVICVVAAGNQGNVGGSALTRHPWVLPVGACGVDGRPMASSNLGSSIGRRGVVGPGADVMSFGADGRVRAFGGTSAAAPFVTGTLALLWSLFPMASADQLRKAIAQGAGLARRTVVPPLLNAWAAYELMLAAGQRRIAS